MINKPENTYQSTSTSTRSTTFEEESVVLSNTHLDPESSPMAMDTLSLSHSDIYTRLKGNLDQIKRYTGEILHHDRSTVELRRDGSICIIPHPRQPPTEIITLIINYLLSDDNRQQQQTLYSCTLVNKQFHSICNPLLWEKLSFEDIFFTSNIMRFFDLPIQIDAERFLAGNHLTSPQRLSTLGSFIVDLQLHSPHWTDDQLKRWTPHLHNLQNLTIGRTTRITDRSFQFLPAYCPQLKSLCLSTPNRIGQPSFSALGRHTHHLEHFEYHHLENETPEWLPWIMPCRFLKSLKLWFMSIPWNPTTLPTLQSWSQLTHLNLFIVNPDIRLKPLIVLATNGNDQVPPPVVDKTNSNNNNHTTTAAATRRASTPWWPQLTHLSLFPITDIDDTTWTAFIKTHSKLQDIHLKEANQLTDISVDAINVWLPSITHVALIGENTWITSNCIRRFIKDTPLLVGLAINVYCQTTADTVLQGLTIDPTDMFLGKLDTMEIEKIRQAE